MFFAYRVTTVKRRSSPLGMRTSNFYVSGFSGRQTQEYQLLIITEIS